MPDRSPRPRVPDYRASLATRPADIDAALALRHEIYVRRMGIVPPEHPFVEGDRLRDALDDHSHHLLLRADGRVVGTARITCARETALEIEGIRDVSRWLVDRELACEVTRLMVLEEYRCWEATRELFFGMWRAFVHLDTPHVFAAGKLGSLSRYYGNLGLRIVDDEPFAYPIVPGSRYRLMLADFGRRGSLRRAAWGQVFGHSYRLGRAVPGLVTRVYRRGSQQRHVGLPKATLAGGTR